MTKKYIRISEYIMLFLATAFFFNSIFSISANQDNLVYYKAVLSQKNIILNFSDNKNVVEKYYITLEDSGLVVPRSEDIKLIKRYFNDYYFEIKVGETTINVLLSTDLHGNIKDLEVLTPLEKREVLNYENLTPYNEEEQNNWQISRWVTDDKIILNYLSDKDTTSTVKSISLGAETEEICFKFPEGTYEYKQETSQTAIFHDIHSDTLYYVSYSPIEEPIFKKEDIQESLKLWEEQERNLFSQNNNSFQENHEIAYTTYRNDYPAALSVIELKDKDRLQEGVCLLVYIPEKNQRILIISVKTTYYFEADKRFSSTEASGTENTEIPDEITLKKIESIEDFNSIKDLNRLLGYLSI